MTVYLSKDSEQFVHDAVRAGRYASEADVLADALSSSSRLINFALCNSPYP
jgi:Arc/MetJ-type ribon-helix-helix transcriptional regulator